MKKLKQGDMVMFKLPYRSVQAGEVWEIDRALYIDDKLLCVYVKTDKTFIYFDGKDFFDYCKPYEVTKVVSISMSTEEEIKKMRDLECKIIDEIIKKAEKQMKDEELAKAMLAEVKPYDHIKPKSFCKIGEDYKKSCDAIDKKLLTDTIEQMKKSMLVKEYDFEQEVINEIDRKSKIIDKEMEKIKNYDHINPNHYKQGGKEVIEMMVDIWGAEDVVKYCEMNAFKYRMRMGLKPNQPIAQELEKAKWYENKAKELRNGKN